MKIALIQRRPFPGQFSVEGYTSRLVGDLRAMGHVVEQTVLPHYSRGMIPRIRNVMHSSKLQGDVVHIAGDVHYTALGCNPRKTVLTILDCAILERLRGWRLGIVRYLWFTLPIQRCAAITVISHETKRVLLEKFPRCDPRKVRVVYVSITDEVKPCPKTFNAECPRILQVGTKGNKNLVRTIQAIRGIPCTFVLVGQPSNEEAQMIREAGLTFENLQGLSDAQLAEEYRKSDLVTFASTIEGFGMPIVEAQMTGRPVLTSNTSSMPEIAGPGACLVDPYDVESIRQGFRTIIGNPGYREELIRLGRENCQRFASREIAEQFAQLYSEVHRSSSE